MKLSKLIGLVALILSIYILWKIRQVVLLAFTAVVLATVINRIVVFLMPKLKVKRGFSIIITFVLLLVVLGLFSLIVFPPFIEQFRELINQVPQGIEQLDQFRQILPEPFQQTLSDTINQLVRPIRLIESRLFGNFFALFSSTFTIIVSTLLVLVLIIMLLSNPKQYRQAFILLFPASFRPRADEVLTQCEDSLAGWFIGIIFNMTVITILSGFGLWILGVPLPLANALLAGLLTFIPNVGPTLSVIPPMAIALLDAPWKALAVLGLYILIQQIESNILTPIVMQKQVSLLPAVTLIAQVAFATFFGFLGLFLALPLTIIAQVLLKELLIRDVLNHA
ncbi:protein of unknown function UPF0118 [Gloeothece citriformis PCC 7424]|uniref:Permease n=1 Tax=Gloeothece citriformis (strain PCC 7424) TaxID=65393 RepID=B7KJT2_GLOC7|nr:AI-2E family transporter [Gloeothece citriformis]ACK69531.1 protein of unknown function UPF0118 [Gloeothece citriformis PCC 7424]